jgi:hypothetical protein
MFFALINLGVAVAICISIARARRNMKLKMIMKSGPKYDTIILTGRGLTVAVIGWGISAVLLTLSGLNALLFSWDLGTSYLLTFISGFLWVLTLGIASYVTPKSKE